MSKFVKVTIAIFIITLVAMIEIRPTANDVLHFWFEEIKEEQYWKKDPKFDQLIRDKFLDLHREAARGKLNDWKETPEGTLALIILFDQFSRNMFRDTKEMYDYDSKGLELARHAIEKGFDKKLEKKQKHFAYMPFMHSEDIKDQELSVKLFNELEGGEHSYAIGHKKIVERFGRFPHRNKILGRKSTPEEIEFLKQPNSSY